MDIVPAEDFGADFQPATSCILIPQGRGPWAKIGPGRWPDNQAEPPQLYHLHFPQRQRRLSSNYAKRSRVLAVLPSGVFADQFFDLLLWDIHLLEDCDCDSILNELLPLLLVSREKTSGRLTHFPPRKRGQKRYASENGLALFVITDIFMFMNEHEVALL